MRAQQRGVALIMAVVLVALATVLAVSIGFSSAMTARRGAATFSVEQGLLFAQGAEALAAYVLQKDTDRTNDTTAEFWNQPYGPVEIAPEVALKAQLHDEQGKFNLNTLLDAKGEPDKDAIAVFTRLLELAGVETRWAGLLVDWLDDNDTTYEGGGGEDSLYAAQQPAGRTGNVTVTSISELLQLPGFGIERYQKLAPHVTALPPDVRTINVCTATPLVLDALYALGENPQDTEYSQLDPVQFRKNRSGPCYPSETDVRNTVRGQRIATHISSKTSYFSLHTVVSIGSTRFTLYSLMLRDTTGARPILRTFGTE
ncbi:MAG: type II secretion system minor pseudopilin GspK [Pseudomonadota bacterium]